MVEVYRRAEGILERPVGQDLMLFDPRDDSLHLLNPSGALVWAALAAPLTARDIEGRLRERFEVGREDAVGADLERLLGELVERGLLLRVAR